MLKTRDPRQNPRPAKKPATRKKNPRPATISLSRRLVPNTKRGKIEKGLENFERLKNNHSIRVKIFHSKQRVKLNEIEMFNLKRLNID